MHIELVHLVNLKSLAELHKFVTALRESQQHERGMEILQLDNVNNAGISSCSSSEPLQRDVHRAGVGFLIKHFRRWCTQQQTINESERHQ